MHNRIASAPSRPLPAHATNGAVHKPPAVPRVPVPAVPVTDADVKCITRRWMDAEKAVPAVKARMKKADAAAKREEGEAGWALGTLLNNEVRPKGRPEKGSEDARRKTLFQRVLALGPSKSKLYRLTKVAGLTRARVDELHVAGVVGITALLVVANRECKEGADGKWTWTGKSTHDAGAGAFAEWLEGHTLPKGKTAAEWRALPPEKQPHNVIATLLDLEKGGVTDPKEWEGPAAVLALYEEWTRLARLIAKRAAKPVEAAAAKKAAAKPTATKPAKVNEPREPFGDAA